MIPVSTECKAACSRLEAFIASMAVPTPAASPMPRGAAPSGPPPSSARPRRGWIPPQCGQYQDTLGFDSMAALDLRAGVLDSTGGVGEEPRVAFRPEADGGHLPLSEPKGKSKRWNSLTVWRGSYGRLMTLSDEDVDKILQNALALQERIMIETREEVESENLGFVYGREAGEKSLRTIIERIPIDRPILGQTAYLVRAIACTQIFNEGNKRMATVFANLWLENRGLRLSSGNPEEYASFMERVVGRCPKIPLPASELLDEDELYDFVHRWLEKRIVKVNSDRVA